MKTKKWEISGLKPDADLISASRTVMTNRVVSLLDSIEDFFADENVEKLHAVRIALRRVRYSMEMFYVCFDRKIFLTFYRKIEKLQDLSGLVRDLDVLKMNLNELFEKDKVRVTARLMKKINDSRDDLNIHFKSELKRFRNGKALSKFLKILF